MAREERSAWILLILAVIGYVIYATIIVSVSSALGTAIAEVDYVVPMLAVIGGSIVLSILLTILTGIGSGIATGIVANYRGRSKEEVDAAIEARVADAMGPSDERDKAISRYAEYGGQAFLVIGALAALVLALFEAEHFWIANALFLAFTLSAVLGSTLKIVAYRRGFPL